MLATSEQLEKKPKRAGAQVIQGRPRAGTNATSEKGIASLPIQLEGGQFLFCLYNQQHWGREGGAPAQQSLAKRTGPREEKRFSLTSDGHRL